MLSLLCLAPAGAGLAADAGTELTVKSAAVGIGGRCKSGFWTPVWLDVQAGPSGARGQLEIVTADSDNVPVIFDDQAGGPLVLQPGEVRRLLRYAKIGPISAPIRVQLRGESGAVWEQKLASLPQRLAATQELIVGVGPALDLPAAIASLKRPAELALAAAQVIEPGGLPDRWWGYEGVDTLVLTTSDSAFTGSISAAQREALLLWLRLGGRLILCVGRQGAELFATGSPWADLAPGKFVEVSPLREATGLDSFTGTELPWGDPDFQRSRPPVTRLQDIRGTVLVDEIGLGGSRPLIVRSPHGLGEVVFIALDLDQPALAKWPGRAKLLATLLDAGRGRKSQDEPQSRRGVTHLGYEDLVGQLRSALDQFPGVTVVNFTTVAVLTGAYLLLIGPGDYFLLWRLNLPRHVTWLSFALVAVAFGVAAWYLGREAHGESVRINQVEIVDVDAQQRVIRGTVWTHLYSPTTARFDLAPQIDATRARGRDPQAAFSWQGLPGKSLGGLGSQQIALTQAQSYANDSPGQQPALVGLAIPSASSKSLSVRWWSAVDGDISSRLVQTEHGPVKGELANPLPAELTDCLLVYGDWLYRLGTIPAGQSVAIDPRDSLNLEYRLTERTVLDAKDISTPWDQATTDVPRIMRMMMFHQAARGSTYTGLTHRYQPYIDLTDQVRLGRAVLAGRMSAPLTRLVTPAGDPVSAADDNHFTWCRIVFPVQPSPAIPPSATAENSPP